jgi:hypothetical protein
MQSALCLMQAPQGRCRSHFTFRSAQRIHEKVALFEVRMVVAGPTVAISLTKLRPRRIVMTLWWSGLECRGHRNARLK